MTEIYCRFSNAAEAARAISSCADLVGAFCYRGGGEVLFLVSPDKKTALLSRFSPFSPLIIPPDVS